MNQIYSSQLISYCISNGMESARAVTIIFAISASQTQVLYRLSSLYILVNDMIMSLIASDDPILSGYQVVMSFMRDHGYREIVVIG